MRVGLVVDSACDLPADFYSDQRLVTLPITIRVGKEEFVDRRDPEATRDFYARHLANAAQAETAPLAVEEIKQLFLSTLVLDYDYVFCLTLAGSRSPVFENATQASLGILSEYKPIRVRAGLAGPFAVRVIDTQNLFAAQGVLAAEAARMIRAGESPARIRERIDRLIPALWGYVLPKDLFHLRARAAKKGDKSVGWFKYAVGSMLDYKPLIRGHLNQTGPVATLRHFDEGVARCFSFIAARIRAGLLTPIVCLSYGGELSTLHELPGYGELRDAAEAGRVMILESMLSITGAINVGEGALAFGFCAEPHEFA